MTERPLHVVRSSDDAIRQARAARGARIDKLGVDRSRWAGAVMPRWCVEAEAREPRFAAIRAEVMLKDRIDAWRRLFR